MQGLFRSPEFCSRPYWDAVALTEAFERFCAGEVEPSQIFWRAINTEIWHRVFFDHDGSSRLGAIPDVHFTRIGDDWMAQRSEAAADALARFAPNPPHHLFAQSLVDGSANGKVYARIPVRTQLFVPGDSLDAGLRAQVGQYHRASSGVPQVPCRRASDPACSTSQGATPTASPAASSSRSATTTLSCPPDGRSGSWRRPDARRNAT